MVDEEDGAVEAGKAGELINKAGTSLPDDLIRRDIEKGVKPRENVKVEIKYVDGTSKTIETLCRIDTDNEILYYENGGILQYVLRKML